MKSSSSTKYSGLTPDGRIGKIKTNYSDNIFCNACSKIVFSFIRSFWAACRLKYSINYSSLFLYTHSCLITSVFLFNLAKFRTSTGKLFELIHGYFSLKVSFLWSSEPWSKLSYLCLKEVSQKHLSIITLKWVISVLF